MGNFILDKSNCRIKNIPQESKRIPYPFQEKAFASLDKLKAENPMGFASMLVLPTGAGKTYTSAHWVIKNYLNQGIKVLWIAHRGELLRQAAEAFYTDTSIDTLPDRTAFESFVISSEFGRSCDIGRADLVIASRQSVVSGSNMEYFLKWAKGRGLKADRKLLIVLDEAHHAAANSYRTIINAMKKNISHVDILGLTATPYRTARSEQGSLKKIFTTGTGIAYSIDLNMLIKAGILANPIHTEVRTNLDMTKIFDAEEMRKIARSDLSSLDEKSMKKLDENASRNKLIVDTYLHNKKKFGQTIVFAVDVLNAIALNKIFQSAGVKSDFVVSSVVNGFNRSSASTRNPQIINDFKCGKLEVLINVNIVTEGTDIPNIQTVFLARPTTSKILMTQMIGRGLRGEAAGGTKETQIVYFVDDWKGLIDFVSPTALLDGEDNMSTIRATDRKKQLIRYIEISEIESCALGLYEKIPAPSISYNNIIPYGIIQCCYLSEDSYGNECDYTRELLVFDEAVEIYQALLEEIPKLISEDTEEYQLRKLSTDLFFRHCEAGSGSYIGISSESIRDLMLSYQANGEMPKLKRIEGRVSLFDIAKEIYKDNMTDEALDEILQRIWESNSAVRLWYEHDFYIGMMHVYCNRLKKQHTADPQFILPPKERMDMGELKKYYPAYYHELKEYVFQNAKQDEDGYYYSAIQEEGQPPIRSKYRSFFEIDHIIPISKGGNTTKENLQLLSRKQNRAKGNTL